MLCKICRQKPSTVFVTMIIDGNRTRRALCEGCAAKQFGMTTSEVGSGLPPRQPLPTDQERPREVELPESISVRELAGLLRLRPFEIIAMLMEANVFASMNQLISFDQAASVCARCSVTARRREA